MRVGATLLVLLFAIAMTPLMGAIAPRWVRADPSSREPVAAIVVLSTSVNADTNVDATATDRLLTALELTRAQPSARLLTTRVATTYAGHALSSDMDQGRLIHGFHPTPRWIILGDVRSTRDEALRAATHFRRSATGITHRIAVVTSRMHTRRACAAFERAGLTVTCIPARERSYASGHLITARDRLAAFRAYIYELVGMTKYHALGWV